MQMASTTAYAQRFPVEDGQAQRAGVLRCLVASRCRKRKEPSIYCPKQEATLVIDDAWTVSNA